MTPAQRRPGRSRAPASAQMSLPLADDDPDAEAEIPAYPPARPEPPEHLNDPTGFDPGTSLLTRAGFKPIALITLDDEVATLERDAGMMRFQRPTGLLTGHYEGPMYRMSTKHIDILATPAQRLWVARPGGTYRGIRADDFFGSKNEWQFRKDCTWAGVERPWMEFAPFHRNTSRTQYLDRVAMDDWMEFLGYYLAEGRACRTTSGGHQAQVSQFRSSPSWTKIDAVIARLGLRYHYQPCSNRFEINSRWLHGILAPLGDAYSKYIPEYVQDLSSRQLRILLDAYLAGDGHLGACLEYGSSSERLAQDIRLICLKLGWCVTLRRLDRSDTWQKRPHWRGRINRNHLRPWWKKGRLRAYASLREEMVPYAGQVHGLTVPDGLVCCLRGDKTYWACDGGR